MSISDDVSSGPELTKKQELNNHKVCMRKWVRQAKVHVIHKLSREAKRYRERKGDDTTKEKWKRKADRFVQEILEIKDLDIDDVSIQALLYAKTLEEVLKDINSSSKDRALARLIHHASVQVQVKAYRDKNPHWKLQIPVLLERSKQKEKKAQQKKLEKLKRKKRFKVADPVIEVKSEADAEVSSESVKSEEAATETAVETAAPSESKAVVESEFTNSNVPNDDSKDRQETSILADVGNSRTRQRVRGKKVTKTGRPKGKIETVNAESKPIPDLPALDKVQGTIKVQVIKDWTEFEKVEPKVKIEEEGTVTEPPKKKPRSSFFVGGEDKEEPEPEPEQKNFGPIAGVIRSGKPGPVRPWKMNAEPVREFDNAQRMKSRGAKPPRYFEQNQERSFERKNFSKSDRQEKSNKFDRSNKYSVKSSTESTPQDKQPAEKLHPSWEAKKRMSIATAAFQGKKITFGD